MSVVWDWGRLLDSVMQNVDYILILNEAQEWSGFQKAEGIWVSKYLLNGWGMGVKEKKNMENLNLQLCLLSFLLLYFSFICWLNFLPYKLGFCIKKSWFAVLMSCLSCLCIPWRSLASVRSSSMPTSGDSRQNSGMPASFSLHSSFPSAKHKV